MNQLDTIDHLEGQLGADLRRSVHAVLDVNLEVTDDQSARRGAILTATDADARPRTSRRQLLLTVAAGSLVIAGVGATALLMDDRADAPSALGGSGSSAVSTAPVAPEFDSIFLPALPIDGYRLAEVIATRGEMPRYAPFGDVTESVPTDATPVGVSTKVLLIADDGTPGQLISFDTGAATPGRSVDDLLADAESYNWVTHEKVSLGDGEAALSIEPVDRFGSMVWISWFADGYQLTLNTRLPADEALAIAESVREVPVAEAIAVRAELDEQLLALDELDRAVLPNGFEVSIRTDINGADADAVCLHAPIVRCAGLASSSSLAGEPTLAFTRHFDVAGTRWIIGWQADAENQPVVVELEEAVDGSIPGGERTIPVEIVAGRTLGAFFAIEDTADGASLKFDADDEVTYPLGGIAPDDLLLSGG